MSDECKCIVFHPAPGTPAYETAIKARAANPFDVLAQEQLAPCPTRKVPWPNETPERG